MGCGERVATELRPDTRKPVTILFNDVAGSTKLGESFEPETVRRVMSRYFEVVSRVCERHGGTVEKFIGDAVMAVFGIPTAKEDHALRGVRAATELRQALASLNEELEDRFGVQIATRTGINSGEVVAGDPAGGQALVTGDAVNVAARLEQAAAAGEILIGDATRRLVPEAVEVESVEPLELKGKSEPVSAWRLLDVISGPAAFERPTDSPMLGRERELDRLRETFEHIARERIAHRFMVLGPAGIGKSRLAQELRAAIDEEASMLVGRCLPYGEGITFWPLAEIVRQAAGDDPRAAIAKLVEGEQHAELIPERVMQAVGLSEGDGTGEDLVWALRRFFEALARRHPLVLVFEDLHWAEPPLLDLIEDLADRTRDVPLMLLCLAREELLEERPDWARGEPNASALVLDPLSENDTRTLINALLPAAAVAEKVRAELVARAEGNPLFVEQMLALLREQGGAGEQIVVPPTIQALLAARLDRLSGEQLAVIGAASVVGKEFWRTAVLALSRDHDPSRIDGALAALVRKELVQPDHSTLAQEDGFSFRHGLIRDAAYESVTKGSRAELHERLAGWLEDGYRHRMIELEAILGYHFEQAYQYRAELGPVDERARVLAQRGATRLASAGNRAARAREDTAAANLLSRASELLPADAPERLELLPLIGEALEGSANHAKAGDVYDEALERVASTPHRGVEGYARLRRAGVRFVIDPEMGAEEIVAEAEQAIAILEEVGDERGLAEAWRLVGEARNSQGRAAEGRRALERALTHITPDVSPRSWNAILFEIGMCLLDGPFPLDETARFAEERLEFARARGFRGLEADMLHVLGASEARRGRFEPAREKLSSSTEISEELGLRYMAQWSKRSLGHLELAAEDPHAAERALRWSYEVLAEMGLNSSLGEAAVPLAEALYAQGRYDEAHQCLEAIKDEWASGDTSVRAPRLAVRAKLLAVEGWDKLAERTATQAVRLVQRTDWACLQADALLAHAEVLRLSDREEDAVPSLREALRIAEAKGYAAAAAGARGLLEKLGEEVTTEPVS
jgi:class 3 adenylate cyclase/tetratricopeptide (TPR) repeat protein